MPDHEPVPAYSKRHLDPNQAAAYRVKFKQSLTRRMSARREMLLVTRALQAGFAWLTDNRALSADQVTLLDYPCGAGRFAPLAAGIAGKYFAGDHSPHMLDLACAALDEAGLGDKLVGRTEGDARVMKLEDKHVDIALCMRLLHHFPKSADRVQILTQLRRVTRGPLITSYLDAESRKQRSHVRRLAKKSRTTRRVLVSKSDFAKEAASAGWRLVESWSLSSLFSGQCIAFCVPDEHPS